MPAPSERPLHPTTPPAPHLGAEPDLEIRPPPRSSNGKHLCCLPRSGAALPPSPSRPISSHFVGPAANYHVTRSPVQGRAACVGCPSPLSAASPVPSPLPRPVRVASRRLPSIARRDQQSAGPKLDDTRQQAGLFSVQRAAANTSDYSATQEGL